MKPTTVSLLLIILVTASQWAKGEFLSIKHAIGAGIFAIMLTVLYEINEPTGQAIAVLVIVAASAELLGELIPRLINQPRAGGPDSPLLRNLLPNLGKQPTFNPWK